MGDGGQLAALHLGKHDRPQSTLPACILHCQACKMLGAIMQRCQLGIRPRYTAITIAVPAVTVAVDCRYGVNEDGNSVCTFVHGFEPYIYIESPTRDFGPDECRSLQHHINVRSAARLWSAEVLLCVCPGSHVRPSPDEVLAAAVHAS